MPTFALAPLLIAALATTAPTSAKDVAQAMFDAFNRHDAAAMGTLYASDARVTSSDLCKPMTGAEVAGYYADFFRRFPDVYDHIAYLVAEGDRVAVRFTAMSQAGPVPLNVPIADFIQVKAGKIVLDETLFDAGLLCLATRIKD